MSRPIRFKNIDDLDELALILAVVLDDLCQFGEGEWGALLSVVREYDISSTCDIKKEEVKCDSFEQ